MNKDIYTIESYNHHIFYFKHEPELPDLLHIYVRHLTSPNDAMQTFFKGTTQWNHKRNRFETHTSKHTIYWIWIDIHMRKVLIITCFTI